MIKQKSVRMVHARTYYLQSNKKGALLSVFYSIYSLNDALQTASDYPI